MPTSGPSGQQVLEMQSRPAASAVQLVDVDADTARQLLSLRRPVMFSETLAGSGKSPALRLGPGDVVEVTVWEAPPATLFASASTDPRQPAAARATVVPEQMVDSEGFITVPFAGRVSVAGKSPAAVEADVAERLRGKANQPEVMVRTTRNASSTVTVVGEVNASVRMPLTAAGERLLDALAAAGGVRQPIGKITLQVTRGGSYQAMPLDMVVRDPRQNIPLLPGDVVTAMWQPLSFTALGATGKNEEINFEAQGISLAQALGRAGGLLDSRSDARSVFVFRMEQGRALEWRQKPLPATPDGKVPVVYRIDLTNPGSFFVMQSFPIDNKDVLYVSNAPASELQKFLNLVFSVVYPLAATRDLFP